MKRLHPIFIVFFWALLKDLVSSIQLRINSSPHTCNPACDGSSNNPFRTLGESLSKISTINETLIQIIFETSKNNTYSLNASDLSQLIPDQTNGLYYIGKGVNYLSFMPENCIYKNSSPSKICSDPNVDLILNSEMVVFLVNIEFALYHVDITGMKNQANISGNTTNFQKFGLFEVKMSNQSSFLKFINSSIRNFNAANYSYLIWISSINSAYPLNLSFEDSNFIGLSFPEQLMNLRSNGTSIDIASSVFSQISCNCLFYSEAFGLQLHANQSEFSNLIGNILFLISKNFVNFSFSKIVNVTSSSKSIFYVLDSNMITFNETSFSSITANSAYGGVLHIFNNNQMNVIKVNCQSASAYIASFLFAEKSNQIVVNSSSFSLCSSVYEAGVFYLNYLNKYTGNNNYFGENKAWKGGAIYLNDSNVIYSEFSTYFKNNAFKLGNDGGIGGGFCLNITTNFTLNSEIFDGNFVDFEGGGFFSNYSNYITLTSVIFSYNTASKNGAGLSFSMGYQLIIRDSSFIKNVAGQWGGSAYCYSYFVEIYDSYFIENAAVHGSSWFNNVDSSLIVNNITISGSSTGWGLGGMFYFYRGNVVNITNSTFLKSNIIPWSIAWVGGVFALERYNNFTLKNVIIEDSLSASTGGVFYIFYMNIGYLYNVSIKNSKTNGLEGGVFYVGESNSLLLEDVTSDKSVSGNIAGFMGSEVYNTVKMLRVKVTNSVAVIGGVIYSNKNNNFIIESCEFSDSNSSQESGMFGTWTLNTIIINNSIFRNSNSKTSGFTYLVSFNTILIYNSSFADFSSEGFGGVIGTFQNNWIEIHRTNFKNTSCASDGGAILLENNNNFMGDSLIFKNSIAGGSGGAFSISIQNIVAMISCSFIDTMAQNNAGGGALYIINDNSIMMKSCVFDNSTVTTHGSGGVVSVSQNNNFNLENITYMNSQSPVSGGVFFMGNDNSFVEVNSRYINISIVNSFQFPHDGACFQAGASNSFNLTNCYFANISTENSGGIFFISLLNLLSFENITFYNITVNFAGALVYAEEQNNCFLKNLTGQLLIGNLFGTGFYVLFSNVFETVQLHIKNITNKASAGGFAYVKDSNTFKINDSEISEVFTQTSGGFFYAEISNKFECHNLTLNNYTSRDSGGLIYLSRNNYVLINDSKIRDINSGFRGGVVFAIGGNQIVFGRLTINSISGLDFGCLFYLTSLNVIYVENSKIVDLNCYKGPGNMIYLDGGNIMNWNGNKIINSQYKEKIDYFYGVESNTIYMYNNSISSNYSHYFLNLLTNHTLKIYSMKVLANSTFYTFISLVNGQMDLQDFFMKFNVYNAIFHIIQNSFAFIKKASLMPANRPSVQANITEFILIYLQNSKLKLTKSTIVNTFGINLNSIYALNGSIYLKRVMSFGAKTLHPGAFGYLFDSTAHISNNLMIESKSLSGGCIYMNFSNVLTGNTIGSGLTAQNSGLLALNMTRNLFKMNRARLEGGVLMFSPAKNKNSYRFSVINNRFELNKAWTGGVVSLNNVNSGEFKENSFVKNSVEIGNFSDYENLMYSYNFWNTSKAKGGAIHTVNSSGILSQNNEFVYNKAHLGGAIYSSTSFSHINDKFNNNSAEFYGADSASFVQILTFLLPNSLYNNSKVQILNNVIIEDLVSGAFLLAENACLLRIAGLDEFSNLAFNSDQQDAYASKISFINSNLSDQSSTNLSFSIKNGQLCFLGAQRNQLPLTKPFIFQVFFNGKLTNLTLRIKFRDCQIGERLTDDYRCVECSPGYYSFQTVFKETSVCLPCKEEDPFICLGGNRLSPKRGYWRSDSSSKNFVKCSKPDACIPYNESLYEAALLLKNSTSLLYDIEALANLGSLNSLFYSGSCEIGFTGPFCNECDKDYGKMGKLNCILCADSSWFYYFLIVLQVVLKVWYLFYCVLMAFKMIIAITMKQASEGAVIAINMLKILVIHVQILSFIMKMPLEWSDNLKTYLPIVFSFSPDISEAFNFECFMRSIGWTLSEQYFILILCPIYIFLIFIVSLLFVGIRKNAAKNPIIRRLSNFRLGLCVFFIIIILTFIDLSKVNLEMFQCLNIADPQDPDYRLVNDVGVECGSFTHELWRFIIAVPVLFICVLLVIFIVFKLTVFFMRNKMESNEAKMEFGYFYYAYKKQYFFWDFVILLRRLLILFFFLFFYEDLVSKSMYPILLMILVLFGSLGLQIYIHPFETEFEIVNNTEQYSLTALCLSYMVMMMYATFYFNNYEIPESLFFVTTLSILVINLFFLGYWSYNYYVFYFSRKMRTFIQAIRDTVRKDGAVWSERLQKEHHVIFKINNYLFKKQFLLNDIHNENPEYNEIFEEISKNEIGLSNLYAKLLSKTMRKVKEVEKAANDEEFTDQLFEIKHYKRSEIEAMIKEPNALTLRLGKSNLKEALFDQEVLLYESPLGSFKITYKKELKGRNFYTYQLINEIRIVGESVGEIKSYDIDKAEGFYFF